MDIHILEVASNREGEQLLRSVHWLFHCMSAHELPEICENLIAPTLTTDKAKLKL